MMRMPGKPLSPEAVDTCTNLMRSGIKSMLLYPPAVFILGKLHCRLQAEGTNVSPVCMVLLNVHSTVLHKAKA